MRATYALCTYLHLLHQVFRAIKDHAVLAAILDEFAPPLPTLNSSNALSLSPSPQRKPRRALSPSSSIVGGESGSNFVESSAVESLDSNGSSNGGGGASNGGGSSTGPPRFSFSSSSEGGSNSRGDHQRGGGRVVGRGRRPLLACLSPHHLTTTGYLPLLASACVEALVTESSVER
jgi:hypothetical protein